MFYAAAGCAVVVGVGYALTAARVPDNDALVERREPARLVAAMDGTETSDAPAADHNDEEQTVPVRCPSLERSA
jgi:hypothetical protein